MAKQAVHFSLGSLSEVSGDTQRLSIEAADGSIVHLSGNLTVALIQRLRDSELVHDLRLRAIDF